MHIPIDRIHIPDNRQRTHFDNEALHNLAKSITRVGLLHAPVIRHNKNTGAYDLVVGERRLRAIKLLHESQQEFSYEQEIVPLDHIPVVYLNRLSADLVYEAELEENVQRKDLTWQEKESAVAQLHELRSVQNSAQTFMDTAREINPTATSPTPIRDAVKLTEHMGDPDIANAKTKQDALKILRDKLIIELTSELSRRAQTKKSRHILYCDRMQNQVLGGISCIVTDPPFGIDSTGFGDQTASAHTYVDSHASWAPLMVDLAHKATDVTKDKAHIYVFCPITKWRHLTGIFSDEGWRVWHRPLIWDKTNQGLVPDSNRGPRFTYDAIMFASKGDKYVTGVYDDVVRVAQTPTLRRGAEKPTRLYIDLLRRSTVPGDHIWDPFCGTGAIIRAAEALNLTGFGTDIDQGAIDIAQSIEL